MTNHSRRVPSAEVLLDIVSRHSKLLHSAAVAAFVALSVPAFAATQSTLPNRVTGAVDNTSRAALTGTMPPRAQHSTDLGAVSPSTKLTGITITFSRSAAQQADLTSLIAAQQTPGSPQYHQWLTPAQFGARFGISAGDLTAVEDWLQSQGFTGITVSPAGERISFSGPEAAIETAFGTSLHFFRATSGSMTASDDEQTHVAPAHDLSVPAALSGIILSVGNLSDYRMKPHFVKHPVANFTYAGSGNTSSYYLDPKDVATIYDIPSTYTGSGQSIAVAGQSFVSSSDINAFQTALFGSVVNTPTYTIVPNTGSAQTYSGDEVESDIDLEYSSSIAQKAAVNFIYTGNASNYGVFDSVIYAIEYRVANIITISYGECEPGLGQAQFNAYESYLQQGAAQGQTVIASSGDSGSSACYGDYNSASESEQLAVNYPASSDYVTALGGTEFPVADLSSTYFNTTTTAAGDLISSAKSYIPEVVWNDDSETVTAIQVGAISSSDFSPSSSGGGVSIYSTRPFWQNATIAGAAIPSSSYRLVPDISLDSSSGQIINIANCTVTNCPTDGGYLLCSSDDGAYGVGFSGSCTSGFRVGTGTIYGSSTSAAGDLTVAGGTSFAAPIFAGMLAILNQATGYTSGQGLLNTQLYATASTGAYSTAFHDIVTGTNACDVGFAYCGTGAQTIDFAAVTGYDEASGLGSIDLGNLISAWPASTAGGATLASTTTSVAPATLTPAVGAADSIVITVAGTGATTPSGTVTVTDNGTSIASATVVAGSATYSYSSTTTGVHTLVFTYGGLAGVYSSSTATTQVNVGNLGFTLSAPSVTVATGGSVSETVTITPANGYTGTVVLGTGTTSTLSNICITGPSSVNLTNSSAVTATFTIYAVASSAVSCPNGSYLLGDHARAAYTSPKLPWRGIPVPATSAGLLMLFGLRRRSRLLRGAARLTLSLAFVLGLGLCSLGLTGCGNGASGASSSSSTGTTTTVGTYNLTVVGHDSVSLPLTNITTATITVTN